MNMKISIVVIRKFFYKIITKKQELKIAKVITFSLSMEYYVIGMIRKPIKI